MASSSIIAAQGISNTPIFITLAYGRRFAVDLSQGESDGPE